MMASSSLTAFSIKCLLIFTLIGMAMCTPPLQIKPNKRDTFFSSAHKNSMKVPTSSRYRLPNPMEPINYKIKLTPCLTEDLISEGIEQFTAPGEVTITLKPNEASTSLYLHQKNLLIDTDTVELWQLKDNSDEHEVKIDIVNHNFDLTKDFYILTLSTPLTPEKTYEIYIKFVAAISQTELDGLYLVRKKDGGYAMATQLQPTHARQAFPCFDEPNLKATFDISLARHKDFHSLSNMNKIGTEQHADYADWEWDHYDTTVKMSTYLVAMVISDFASETVDSSLYPGGKTVTVWAEKYLVDQQSTTFAGNATSLSLAHFDSLFDIDYFMPKMDAVALPQFGSAMENTGLNLYRYELFLYTPNESTEEDRKLVNLVVGHEVSHQWMGDLVTCKWWEETWLNEGFARFLQYWSMWKVTPEFKPDIIIISDVVHEAMKFDQGPETHPLRNDVMSPEEVEMIFDGISYNKGSSVLRMMEGFLTSGIFLQGLQIYLEKRKYDGVVQDDLFEALNSVGSALLPAGVSLEKIMNSWTLQSGYPIVRVTKASNTKIYLSQEKFSPNVNEQKEASADDEGSWYIPVKIVSAKTQDFSDKLPTTWIPNDVALISYDKDIDTTQWIIVNPDQIAYYRVLYDIELRKLIQQQLEKNSSLISPGTRSQLINDYFYFAKEKYLSIESALEFTTYLASETELVVWTAVLSHLESILIKFTADPDAVLTFSDYFMPKFEAALNDPSIGWDQPSNDQGPQVITRAKLLDYACTLNHPKCLQNAKTLFDSWFNDPTDRTRIPADIRPIVFCAAVAQGDETIWSQAFQLYNEEVTNEATKSQIYNALACSSERDSLTRYLDDAYIPSFGFEIVSALQNVARNSFGRDLAYSYIKEKYRSDGVIGPSAFASVIEVLSEYWNEQRHIEDLLAFIKLNEETLGLTAVDSLTKSIVKIEANIAWWKEDGVAIQSWMKAHGSI